MSLITIGQVITAVLAIILVLMQDRSSGAGGLFGGGGGGGAEFYQRRRGMEKIIFISTIVTVSIFALLSILNLIF